MENIDQLIHAQWIITCEEENRILENHALVIKEGKILAILPSKNVASIYVAKEEINYSTHVVMPGLINSHTHIPMNMFRGLADDLEFMEWLNNYIWPAENTWLSEELVRDGSSLAIAEMIRGGTTCFNDMYFFLTATAEAVEKAGVRAAIGMSVMEVPTTWAKTAEEYFKKSLEFYEQYKKHALITPTVAPQSPYSVSIENLVKVKQIADEYGLKINIHLQESPWEIQRSMELYNKRPIERLKEIDFLSPEVIAIHMTQLAGNDFDILTETRPNIVHCPESNMKLAITGQCQVQKLLNMGLNVALGTDGAASNNDLDMFSEMRSAAFLGKIVADDSTAVAAETVIKMATINGAKALGIDHLTGSLAPNKMADFIAIDMDCVETQPLYHPLSQLVYATPRHQVTDVWVAGKQLLKNRQLLTLDEKELISKARTWSKKIKI